MLFGVANSSPQNFLVQAIVQRELSRVAKAHASGRLIDIGCGEKPYAQLMKAHVSEHVGVDHEASLHDAHNRDLIGTAYEIPVENESFDTALCSAVLEHLEEPGAALAECFRILKHGAHAIYTVPFIWHLHEEPRDFYRFSKHGLRYLFEKAGFEVVEIKPLSGFWVTFGQLLVYNLYRFNRGPLRWLRIIDAIAMPMHGFFYLLDRIDRTEQWTWMYMVVARKP